MIKYFKDFFRRNRFPLSKHIIKYAFTCDGVEYYQFEEIFNLPYLRALQALMYYREMTMNVDHDFLKAHTEAVKNCLTPTAQRGKLDVNAVYSMNEQLAQRLTLPPDTEILYKLASVVFFDKHEKPESYEFSYCDKKIASWKKNFAAKDFFLQKPILELVPFLKQVGEDINTYQQMISEIKSKHLAKVLAHLSEKQKKALSLK